MGKTTLARQIAAEYGKPTHWFDLERPRDRDRLVRDPESELEDLRGLVVIDEVQHAPDLFMYLRVLADRNPLPARFIVLGSASYELLRQESQSLAGRIAHYELTGFSLEEHQSGNLEDRWLRGGFPRALLARSDRAGFDWLSDFVATLLARDLPQLGRRGSPETMERLWAMLAYLQGQHLNCSDLARNLQISDKTVRAHIDLLTGMLVVRQLKPWVANVRRRQVKAPKVYIRDSGVLHTLLRIQTMSELRRHPILGASWEGLALELVVSALGLPARDMYFWRTHQGAGLDLFVSRRRLGIEFKQTSDPRVTRSMRTAIEVLDLKELIVVYRGRRSYSLGDRVRAVGLEDPDFRNHLLEVPETQGSVDRRYPVQVRSWGKPVPDAQVVAFFPNNTSQGASTDQDGTAQLSLHSGGLPMTLFVAKAGFAAKLKRDWIPEEGDAEVDLIPLAGGGSVVFDRIGCVPGVSGRLNPIRDEFNRTYLFADNIAVNGTPRGSPHPFVCGDILQLEDAEGRRMSMRILEFIAASSLAEYREVS